MRLKISWFKITRENEKILARLPLQMNMFLSTGTFLIILVILFIASVAKPPSYREPERALIIITVTIISLIVTIQLRSLYLFLIHRFKVSFLLAFDHGEWLAIGVFSTLSTIFIAMIAQLEYDEYIAIIAINGIIASLCPIIIVLDKEKQTFSIFLPATVAKQRYRIPLPRKVTKVVLKHYDDLFGEPPEDLFEIIISNSDNQDLIIVAGFPLSISWQTTLAKEIASFLDVQAEYHYRNGFREDKATDL
jgi:uncharacterized membrane protein